MNQTIIRLLFLAGSLAFAASVSAQTADTGKGVAAPSAAVSTQRNSGTRLHKKDKATHLRGAAAASAASAMGTNDKRQPH